MNKHLYSTLIKSWAGTYVHGAIFGIQYATCGNIKIDAFVNGVTGDIVIGIICTESQYEEFKRLVKELYPDTCEFDYQYEDFGMIEEEFNGK